MVKVPATVASVLGYANKPRMKASTSTQYGLVKFGNMPLAYFIMDVLGEGVNANEFFTYANKLKNSYYVVSLAKPQEMSNKEKTVSAAMVDRDDVETAEVTAFAGPGKELKLDSSVGISAKVDFLITEEEFESKFM